MTSADFEFIDWMIVGGTAAVILVGLFLFTYGLAFVLGIPAALWRGRKK